MQFIGGLFSMLIVVYLFSKIRGFIFKRIKKNNFIWKLNKNKPLPSLKEIIGNPVLIPTLKISIKDLLKQKKEDKEIEGICLNASIGKTYKKGNFNFEKFKDNFTVTKEEGKKWGKTLSWWLNWRNWAIVGIIVSSIFAYGYFQGRLNAPVKVNMSYDKAWVMNLNGEEIYKPKFSNDVFIRDSKTKEILKQIKAKDMGLLRKKLKPIGFCLEPIFVAGGSVGGLKNKGEIGVGVSFIKYWRWKLETFITSYPALYLGTSYAITENSGVGVGVGKGIDSSNRIILYCKFKF